MSVNKRILESKTSQELEDYIKTGNRFVPEAQIIAFEILKSRGRVFSEEEMQRISSLTDKERVGQGEIIIHKNYKKASEFIYISATLGIFNAIWQYEILTSGAKIFISVATLGIIFLLGYLISKGTDWVKYLLLIMMVFGVFGLPFFISNIMNEPFVSFINIIQTILQFWALILLFNIPKIIK